MKNFSLLVVAFCASPFGVTCFAPSSHSSLTPARTVSGSTSWKTTTLAMAKKSNQNTSKGFASKSATTPVKKEVSGASADTTGSNVSATTKEQPPPPSSAATTSSSSSLNAGQRALEEMRQQRAQEQEKELRRAREVLDQDKLVAETPAAIPEKVAQRMGQRMLPFVGLPLFLGMGSFVGFWYFATYKNMEFQPVLVAATTIGMLVIGLLGITYSVMSASWDADREGSFLGTEEFSRNVDNIKEGLQRSRENAILRDKMATNQQFNSALQELDQKESKEKKKQQSLQNKMKDEFE